MIDPIHALAFSIQANPGVYAVLVGSGISRAANIPTGWEITLDLVRKLAELHGEDCEPDPEQWYQGKFNREADYSVLLDALAKTPTERQQLLRPYWEPNGQEREEGAKQPTAAHHAIAALAVQGFIKIIVTTNFDRLLESALRAQGLEPTVLSSPDQVLGALPLIHTRCCVFKLHGDYLDTRIRNIPSELDQYPQEYNDLLDRIFDEFGLVICGWSAEWDGALRTALSRAPSRRFTTYWAARETPGDEAQRLIAHRDAQLIRIENADTFFTTVQQHVESIERFSKPHPLSVEVAIANMKRYISEPRYRIQLFDLIDEITDRVVESVSGDEFSVTDPTPTSASVTDRVRRYEAACSTLLAMAPTAGYWANEDHYEVWGRCLERLSSRRVFSGEVFWLELQRYPATLVLYALGLGALESDRLRFIGHLFETIVPGRHERDMLIVEVLPLFCLFEQGGQVMRILEGMERHYAPLNEWMHDMLRLHAQRIIPDKNRYTFMFDKFEILIALGCLCRQEQSKQSNWRPWAPPGAFGYRYENRNRIIKEIEQSLSESQNDSPFVESQIFGKNVEECIQIMEKWNKFMATLGWR